MKYIPLAINTNYELMSSLIKIDDLISFALDNNINALGIVDTHMFSCMEFYNSCKKNNIKPIIGIEVNINNSILYLYARNYNGYVSLCNIVSAKEKTIELLSSKEDIIVICSYTSYNDFKDIFNELYIYYSNDFEKKNASMLTSNIVYINKIKYLNKEDSIYLNYLEFIKDNKNIDSEFNEYNNYYIENSDVFDIKTTIKFSELINIEFPDTTYHIPVFNDNSFEYLKALTNKGLSKRLNGNITSVYSDRLEMELNTIKDMGFVDYFLIVYDIVLYASKHNILIGPGRGSAAGSLVSYSLGISTIDPLKYGLLFERFLNKDRITMPDIDMDFDSNKRNEIIEYVEQKYGKNRVSRIISFNSLNPKQVIRDVSKVLKIENIIIDKLCKTITNELNFEELKLNREFSSIIRRNTYLNDLIKISSKLCGLKKSTSIHAAGVVISDMDLDNLIPMYHSSEHTLTGYTMNYIESLGLLKMDFLAIDDLTLFFNILNDIKNDNIKLEINSIPLDDKNVFKLFSEAKTDGIFQFRTPGMKRMLLELKPNCFNDLVDSVALFRRATKDMIPEYIKCRSNISNVKYLIKELKPILESTYGIIIYQEQVLEILRIVSGYSYQEADIVRRAMSKKKIDVIEKEKQRIVSSVINLGYNEEIGIELYNLILKFSEYGFNKSHSVSYAFFAYQMAYLKSNYPLYFFKNILNTTSSKEKIKDLLKEAQTQKVKIHKVDINKSLSKYSIYDNSLVLPLSLINGINSNICDIIVDARSGEGFKSFEDFMIKCSLDKKIVISLIECGAFDTFNLNKKQTILNLDKIINYIDLCRNTDSSLIPRPLLEVIEDYTSENIDNEIKNYGFYLSKHPVTVYDRNKYITLENFEKYFSKKIKIILLVESVKEYKDKNGNTMAFLTLSDEFKTIDGVVFSRVYEKLNIKKGKIYVFLAEVTKRYSDYQLTIIDGRIVK